ncbi:hypothetical protein PUNSTDRAFT_65396 [Punctularia strigosozonata HHB-11173 SS5]|uniref:uncharacterized protein n=1 Tax=Punctularia strigosozonata (strain HHB-11173) TaxID=741275 RepID=UPI00044170B1|nr:uncharacterized protein PUNSTDRAFT_65396 [Punctularia strigosozonata HHB-11173 SS5]EIN11060.1 hypothetical protein PUNSTDRAFT_65396 [Punctularia strigosozonata HHB-11173 SS5]
MSVASSSRSIAGFAVIPVAYSSSTPHYIYARAHSGTKKANKTRSGDQYPDGRTLFLVNVPPDATEREIIVLFKHCGTIERVSFQGAERELSQADGDEDSSSSDDEELHADVDEEPQPRQHKKRRVNEEQPPAVQPLPSTPLRTLKPTGRSAHVVFLDSSSLDRALSPSSFSNTKLRPWLTSDEPSGLTHYLSKYQAQRPALDIVKAHADTYMERFEYDLAKKKAAAKSKYRKGEAIVDEDGFTLVTRGGAYGQTVGGGVGVASKRFQETASGEAEGKRGRGRRKKERKEKEGFYAFQLHEKKRNELLDLKRNWEADKAKIEELKASRRFKPY